MHTSSSAVNIPMCSHCGALHSGTCPRIKSISYHPNGMIASIEFHPDYIGDSHVYNDFETQGPKDVPRPEGWADWSQEQKDDFERRLWTTGVKLSEVPSK